MELPKMKEIVSCLCYAAHKMGSFWGATKEGAGYSADPHGVPL